MNSAYTMQPVSAASTEARAVFITRTYLHLLGAILGFTLKISPFSAVVVAAMKFNP